MTNAEQLPAIPDVPISNLGELTADERRMHDYCTAYAIGWCDSRSLDYDALPTRFAHWCVQAMRQHDGDSGAVPPAREAFRELLRTGKVESHI